MNFICGKCNRKLLSLYDLLEHLYLKHRYKDYIYKNQVYNMMKNTLKQEPTNHVPVRK